jgi:hypothetical protein
MLLRFLRKRPHGKRSAIFLKLKFSFDAAPLARLNERSAIFLKLKFSFDAAPLARLNERQYGVFKGKGLLKARQIWWNKRQR